VSSRPAPDEPSGRPRSGSKRVPIWQLTILGVVRAFQGAVTHPLRRMWRSQDPIDAFALNHLTSVAGDTLLAISLAESIFFSLPVDESRVSVAEYLLLTMLPLALAGPLLVPILDRAGPRRSITFAAAAGRAILAVLLAGQLDTLALFPLALLILVLSKVHGIAKNGLTLAYASKEEGLLRANARLGRIAVAGAIAAAPFGIASLKIAGGATPIQLAAITYAASALLTLRLPRPRVSATPADARSLRGLGRVPSLRLPAMGAIGLRAAGGFLLFLLAFSLRSEEVPAAWFGILAGAGVLGSFLADVLGPSLPARAREEAVVVACVSAAGVGALLASQLFGLPLLTVYALISGAAVELARLAFQSLMQRRAPAGALGRVFVRYEVLSQLAWVVGAFIPTLLPISFRLGIVLLAAFYAVLAVISWWRWRRAATRRAGGAGTGGPG
jgi:hypothetical protein